ncbi:low temperature requirement protein A [Actinosynnema sp. NPDC020468]|uniref:low temperature requirement protein A n=1 Tax=Actinosynnema sp. NPDC020468 TaxID=3154488 RepID=UPI0033D09BD3
MTWYRPMAARRTDEEHRVATPLELLFDLCFVVAVASAAAKLHHSLAEDHVGHGLLGYLSVFFAIWWAWLQFTWFASAYDTDDVPYRITTLVQIAGVLVVAAGVPRAFDSADFRVITAGYVVMRLAMVAQWLRAARSDPAHRACAHRYALGITLVQLGWLARLWLPDNLFLAGFLVLVVAELAVPWWAERAGTTSWHPHHIAERYGLFTLIVLGESILAATNAIRSGLDAGHAGSLIGLAVAGLVIVFSVWWLYFDHPAQDLLTAQRFALAWGYGHFFVFASVAALGAGLEVAVDHELHEAPVSAVGAGLATTVPVAVFLLVVWWLQVRPARRDQAHYAFPAAALLVLLGSFAPAPVPVTAVVLAALVAVVLTYRRAGTHSVGDEV